MGGNSAILDEYLPGKFSDGQISSFEKLEKLIREWNQKINIISRRDTENIWTHHILHSLAILKFFDFSHVKNVLDVGTGGGFPGLPLAIALPGIRFMLVDGRGKKIQVVQSIIEELGLSNRVMALNSRSEEIRDKFDVVTGRAVTDAKVFIENERKRLNRGGQILYWTGAVTSVPGSIVFDLEQSFEEEWFRGKCIVQMRQSVSKRRRESF